MTSTVARALSGPEAAGLPGGTLVSRSPTAASTVIGISMITVPATVGVRTRWNSASRQASPSGTRAEGRPGWRAAPAPATAVAAIQRFV